MNYNVILGIPPDASVQQIKEAYHKLASKYHPDKNPGNAVAADMFKLVNTAYEVAMSNHKNRSYTPPKQQEAPKQKPKGPAKSKNQPNDNGWAVVVGIVVFVCFIGYLRQLNLNQSANPVNAFATPPISQGFTYLDSDISNFIKVTHLSGKKAEGTYYNPIYNTYDFSWKAHNSFSSDAAISWEVTIYDNDGLTIIDKSAAQFSNCEFIPSGESRYCNASIYFSNLPEHWRYTIVPSATGKVLTYK